MEDPQKVVFRTEKPQLQLEDDEHFSLITPFVVKIDESLLVVPAGFITDFDSVPKIPFAYLMLDGSGKRSALMHDFLYSVESPPEFKNLGRRWADRAFWRGMLDEGLDQGVADAKYAGVRLGGESHWKTKP